MAILDKKSKDGGPSGGGRNLTMKDVMDAQLAHAMNDAIDCNDLARLKALLNHPSLNLGVVDDRVAAGYMETLRNIKEEPGTYTQLLLFNIEQSLR